MTKTDDELRANLAAAMPALLLAGEIAGVLIGFSGDELPAGPLGQEPSARDVLDSRLRLSVEPAVERAERLSPADFAVRVAQATALLERAKQHLEDVLFAGV